MQSWFSRAFAVAVLLAATGIMMSVSYDAEARRLGGLSFGRQSMNVTRQRKAATPPAAKSTAQASTAAANGARTGLSRWLGPVAGIAAGLGIAALLSHFGLSGAFLELVSSLVLIGLIAAAILFIVRRLRGEDPLRYARAGEPGGAGAQASSFSRFQAAADSSGGAQARPAPPEGPVDTSWFIPSDFDTGAFLEQAKAQFRAIQAIWDSGDTQKLAEYLTDDLIAELRPRAQENREAAPTEVVLLNAELLGIETVSDGHLASVRYSGMLREGGASQAFRFEEVWNLYKADNAGWLLAGIQQIPTDQAP